MLAPKTIVLLKKNKQTNTSEQQIAPTIKTVSYDNVSDVFNRLKSQYKLDGLLLSKAENNLLGKSTIDTLGVTIYTDEIKEVTLGNYTSYTMRMAFPSTDSTKFYNITVEDKNGESGMFVTKYTPTQDWLDDKSKAYKGDIQTKRVVEEITQEFAHDGGGGIGGAGSNSYSEPTSTSNGSIYYPQDCTGYVYVSIVEVAIRCQCASPGHLPNQCVGECDNEGYYDYIPMYYCVESNESIDNPDGSSGSNNNNNNPGGNGNIPNDTSSPNDDDPSVSTFIPPGGECDLPPSLLEYDIDGICGLSPYEICLMNDYNDEICDCIAIGNNHYDCLFEYEIEQLYSDMDKLCQSNTIGAFFNINSEITNKITNAFFGNDNYNLRLFDVDFPNTLDGIALTVPLTDMILGENTIIDIRFDNFYLENTTNLSMALTTAHELIHVNFIYLYLPLYKR